ncbi:hypothetical protein PAPB9_02783 [Pseudomonas aeruginosa]|nr:hypothetical protein PAPB9_02783 [Pseudomonas aeruginosa]
MRTIALRRGLAALLVAALSYGVQADEKSANTLRIGYQKYGTLVLLKARGTLEKRLAEDGVKVQWTEFPGGPQLLEGLNVGSIDFGVTGETPPVFAQAAGADLLYVAYEPPAPTSEAILLPKDSPIRSVAELKGRKVALNKGSNVHYLLVRALEQAGLKYSDIQPVYLPPADARAAFERHSVDAWVIWDPYQAAAEKQLSARVLVDGRELVDNHQFYLATRTYAQRHPQVLDKLVDEIRQVGDWSRANPQQVTEQVAPLLGLPADITLTAVKRQGYGAQLINRQGRQLTLESIAMSLEIFWFLPTHGDGHYLGTTQGARAVDHGYLQQIAQAADRLGFGGVLIPTGRSCEDSWLVAASLIPVTQRLKFLVALRPGIISPTVAARQAATLDRLSNGRALFNLVTGGDPDELAGDGLHLSHAERYEASVEFTRIWRRVLEGETVDYAGKHIQVKGAKLLYPPLQQPRPPLYFGGSSEAAQDLAAEQVELYLTWGEPPAAVAEKIAQVREKAARQGRQVRFGIRLHVIVRETSEEAWQAADRLIAHLDDDTIARAQASLARFDSVGQQRMAALHGGSRDNLEVSPNLWAGVGLVRGGAGTALVGDGPTVAARVREYAELGIDTFIFSGYPHLEESYRVAELLFPHLDVQRPAQPEGRGYVSPFGEMVANDILPRQAAQS